MIWALQLQPLPLPVKLVFFAFVLFGVFWLVKANRYVPDQVIGSVSMNQKTRLSVALGLLVFVFLSGLVSIKFALFLVFAMGLVTAIFEMIREGRISGQDFAKATTLFGKISAVFGWTQSWRVARGEDKRFSFGMFLTMSAMMGLFATLAQVAKIDAG